MRRTITAVITAVVAVGGVTTAVSGPAPAAAPLSYVALGDSYSAASGVQPPDPDAPAQCLRSTRNYPHVLAERLGADLTDVTCGAADTGDYAGSQYDGVAPQLDALKPDTQLVTMTIGGNDSGVFINAILECGTAGTLTLGMGSPCKDRYGDSFEQTIRDTTYPSLVNALTAVHQRAPQARVVIIGYPWILPQTGGCYPTMPVATGDVPYLRSLQNTLNDAVARAAAATGTTYVDLNGVSEGHDACQPIGTRWVEPVAGGTNPVIVHPNALGESKIAEQVLSVLRTAAPGLVGSSRRVSTKATLRLRRHHAHPVLLTTVSSVGQGQIPGLTVVLQKQIRTGGWVKVRTLTTTSAGRAVARVRPAKRTTYRFKTRKTALYAATRSRPRTVRP